MKIYSYYRDKFELLAIEVEVLLTPGLPKFTFIGLPDLAIKESVVRIRSALSSAGYTLPKGMQVIVNLKPAYIKKSSCGLELAVAVAYLLQTQQIDFSQYDFKELYVYGELSLTGDVFIPNDIDYVELSSKSTLITGMGEVKGEKSSYQVSNLIDLSQQLIRVDAKEFEYKRPEIKRLYFPEKIAKLLALCAHGKHSIFLAGPSGTGKTTFAESLYQILDDPSFKSFKQTKKINKFMGENINWRPFVSPHHSTPKISMIGGGNSISPGEITRAHLGVLLLDELLEFSPAVIESLREPIQSGSITVSRGGQWKCYPADFLLIATTNLCPCGDLIPGKISNCRFSLTKCRSYMEKLSGPFLDRFNILYFLENSEEDKNSKQYSLEEINDLRVKAGEFVKNKRNQLVKNSQLDPEIILKDLESPVLKDFFPNFKFSKRRELAYFQVARSLADLEGLDKINLEHLKQAQDITFMEFEKIKNIFN